MQKLIDKFQLSLSHLLDAQKKGKLSHAYIIYGNDISLLDKFCSQWINRFLAIESNGTDTLEKEGGSIFEEECYKRYPSFFLIKPSNKRREIAVGDIRNLINDLLRKSPKGQKKIAVIYKAECLNKQAQNALLKTLEDPVGDTLFILLTEKKNYLFNTILSRCQKIPIFSYQKGKDDLDIEFKIFFGINEGLRVAQLVCEEFKSLRSKAIEDKDYKKYVEKLDSIEKLPKKKRNEKLSLKEELLFKEKKNKYLNQLESFLIKKLKNLTREEAAYIMNKWQEFSELIHFDFMNQELLIRNLFLALSIKNFK